MVVAAGIAAGALVGGIGSTPAHAATSNATYFINAINAQRAAHGRAKLTADPTMMAAAQHWAQQMAKSNKLYHNPHLATSVSNWKYLGENVGVGYSNSSLESAFYASTPHRDNMLDKDYTQIGVAVVVIKGKYWVAEEYRRPMHATVSAKVAHKTTHKAKAVTLKVGSRGARVRAVQRLLHVTADGIFGPHTKAAVEKFQRHHHLKVNGRVGPKTLAALRH
jgi:murein L,D-transpeptidase YcbB/YkuD